MLWRHSRLVCRSALSVKGLWQRSYAPVSKHIETPVTTLQRNIPQRDSIEMQHLVRLPANSVSQRVSPSAFRSSSGLAHSATVTEAAQPAQPSDLQKHVKLLETPPQNGTTVKLAGLVRSIRKQKKFAFAHLSDGTTLAPIQAVLSPEQAEQ